MGLTEAQKALRRTGISASDVASIVGVNPWRGPMDVYLDKMGLTEEQQETPAMAAGNRLEPVIADWYADDRGIPRDALRETGTVCHQSETWMLATPDRIVSHGGEKWGLECKTAGINQRHAWGDGPDDVPDYYRTQVAWCMAVTGLRRWDLAVLIGGQDFRVYTLTRDLELETALIERCRAFWLDHVAKQEPPELDASDATRRLLANKYPKHDDEVIHATPEFEALAQQLHGFKADEKLAKEGVAKTTALLINAVGDKAGIVGTGWRFTWRETVSAGVDYKGLAEELKPSPELIKKYERPGYRRPDFRWKGEK